MSNRMALHMRVGSLVLSLALTAIATRAAAPVEIPFSARDGRVFVSATVNGTGPLTFLVDSGYELVMLKPPHPQTLGLRRVGGVTVAGISGDERADRFSGATFQLGAASFTPRSVASLPSDAKRRGRDGVLGSSFFQRFIVEIDPVAGRVRLHKPGSFSPRAGSIILPLEFDGEVPVLVAKLQPGARPAASARLKLDTGCDGGVCLGSEFSSRHGWAALAGGDSSRTGVGGGTRTREVRLDRVELAEGVATNVTAHLFPGTAPGGDGIAGHLGMEVLKQFRVVFDYGGRRLVLIENQKR